MYSKAHLIRIFTVTLLVLLFSSCSQNTRTAPTGPTVAPSTPSGTHEITFRVGNLLIRSQGGIQCENHEPLHVPSDGGNLVLATDRLKYDSAELQQMEAYVQSWAWGSKALLPLPNTLSWVSGGDKLRESMAGFTGCHGKLAVTNVGSDSIQIQSMNIRLTSPPQKSDGKQHHLIDICSLLGLNLTNSCMFGKGGAGVLYDYFQLSPGEKGKVFSPQALDLLKNMTYQIGVNANLSSNETTSIDVLFDSLQSNIIYSILPELLINTSSGQQNVTLPQLSTKLYFSSQSLFPCYFLRGDAFVASTPPNNPGITYCI